MIHINEIGTHFENLLDQFKEDPSSMPDVKEVTNENEIQIPLNIHLLGWCFSFSIVDLNTLMKYKLFPIAV